MKTKLWLRPVVTVFVLCLAVAIVGLTGVRYLSKKSRYIIEETLPSVSHMALANQYRSEAFLHLICAVNAKEAAELRSEEKLVCSFSEKSKNELELLGASKGMSKHRQMFDDFMAERDHYIKTRDKIFMHCNTGNEAAAMQEMVGKLLPMYERYLNKGQDLVNYLCREGKREAEAINTISSWIQIFTVISSILIFFFGLILGYTR